MIRNRAGELERIAGVVGEADHFIALVVVAENNQAVAESGPGRANAQRHLLVLKIEVGVRQRLALVKRRLLDLVKNRQKCHRHGM